MKLAANRPLSPLPLTETAGPQASAAVAVPDATAPATVDPAPGTACLRRKSRARKHPDLVELPRLRSAVSASDLPLPGSLEEAVRASLEPIPSFSSSSCTGCATELAHLRDEVGHLSTRLDEAARALALLPNIASMVSRIANEVVQISSSLPALHGAARDSTMMAAAAAGSESAPPIVADPIPQPLSDESSSSSFSNLDLSSSDEADAEAEAEMVVVDAPADDLSDWVPCVEPAAPARVAPVEECATPNSDVPAVAPAAGSHADCTTTTEPELETATATEPASPAALVAATTSPPAPDHANATIVAAAPAAAPSALVVASPPTPATTATGMPVLPWHTALKDVGEMRALLATPLPADAALDPSVPFESLPGFAQEYELLKNWYRPRAVTAPIKALLAKYPRKRERPGMLQVDPIVGEAIASTTLPLLHLEDDFVAYMEHFFAATRAIEGLPFTERSLASLLCTSLSRELRVRIFEWAAADRVRDLFTWLVLRLAGIYEDPVPDRYPKRASTPPNQTHLTACQPFSADAAEVCRNLDVFDTVATTRLAELVLTDQPRSLIARLSAKRAETLLAAVPPALATAARVGGASHLGRSTNLPYSFVAGILYAMGHDPAPLQRWVGNFQHPAAAFSAPAPPSLLTAAATATMAAAAELPASTQ
ncbi:hypothetical protein H9P43_003576 [Blastocladiella emersonii ATCC 22665]|nr:hypothetical protein H9P43_003576 [Blastocladiella emersonii ATCC 22665]